MRAVNLLPKDIGKPQRRMPDPVLLVGIGGGFLVAVALAALTLSASGTLIEKRDAVADAETTLLLVPEPDEPASAADQGLAQEQSARSAALTTALSTRLAWDRVLRRFSLVLPEDVWLTSLAARAPGAAGGGVADGFTIVGHTYSHDGVARLLSRLAVVPDLANVQLQRSTLIELAGREVVEFAIVADIRTEGTAS
jgi:hypothetical protein